MGTKYREVKKTLKGIGSLDYVEVRNVPMRIYETHGEVVHSKVLGELEKMVAREIISRRLPLRGYEVQFFRQIFALSQRALAEQLGLSHVAILKWERAKGKRLDKVNEVAFKALMAGMLNMNISASIDALYGPDQETSRLLLDFSAAQKVA